MKPTSLEPGFFVFRGAQGAGKTSLAAAMINTEYKYYNQARVESARAFSRCFAADNNGQRLTIAKHLFFSNIKIVLDPKHNVVTHYVDTQRLGLPNLVYEVQYLPPRSVVFIQESDTQLFNRNYKDTSDYLIALLKYVRHNELTIIFDTQHDSALDKAVRRLAQYVYHVIESYDRKFLWFRLGRQWSFLRVNNYLNDAVKELAALGVHIRLDVVRKGVYRFRGDVFKRFNSFSGRAHFLRYIRDYEYLAHPSESLNVVDVEAYCEAHPLVAPKR